MENLINQEKPIYDHIRYGKNTMIFVLPPRDLDTIGFDKEEIKKISLEKIAELNFRLHEIADEFSRQEAKLIFSKLPWNLNLPYLVAKFRFKKEKFYIKKWIDYWMRLGGISAKTNKIKNKLPSRLDIGEAKNYPIEDLYQGELRQVGGRLQGLCPFHEEKTPSFFIFPDNHFYCFGCQEHGSAIDFLMKTKNIDFVSAVRELQG
jgi:hypothetical protein